MTDDGMKVTVSNLSGYYSRAKVARPKWAYAIDRPGEAAFVSQYRYGSAEAARVAGERDLAELRDYLAQEGES